MSFQPELLDDVQDTVWDLGLAERSENAGPDEAAGLRTYYWENGRILRVRFMEGTPEQHAMVTQYASAWMDAANIYFDFDSSDEDAEIRVGFGPSNGNWSQIGTICLSVPTTEKTMNLGDLAVPDLEESHYKSVVRHEFGHALGLIHEHQSPNSTIDWNEDAVKNDMYQYGWGR